MADVSGVDLEELRQRQRAYLDASAEVQRLAADLGPDPAPGVLAAAVAKREDQEYWLANWLILNSAGIITALERATADRESMRIAAEAIRQGFPDLALKALEGKPESVGVEE